MGQGQAEWSEQAASFSSNPGFLAPVNHPKVLLHPKLLVCLTQHPALLQQAAISLCPSSR